MRPPPLVNGQPIDSLFGVVELMARLLDLDGQGLYVAPGGGF